MLRAMIVEDNVSFREMLKGGLLSQFPSMEVIEAGNGEEAFRKLASYPIDLIFMDIGLPGENGLELTRRIKIKYPDIMIIILSSYDSIEYRETAIRHKADFFLAKGSSTPDDVCRLVEAILLGEGFNANGSEQPC